MTWDDLAVRSLALLSRRLKQPKAKLEQYVQAAIGKLLEETGPVAFPGIERIAWCTKVARNEYITEYRKMRRLEFREGMERALEAQDNEFFNDEATKVDRIMKTLPDRDGRILSMSIVDGLNHKVIAKILGISHSAVRKAFERAQKKFRKLYGNR